MRRLTRLERPIRIFRICGDLPSTSPYLCLACKHQSASFTTSTRQTASDSKTPFTEKVRQRIWGTDQPPGLADPYGETSYFDQTKKGGQGQSVKPREAQPRKQRKPVDKGATEALLLGDVDNTGSKGYKRASTWDNLQWVGGSPVSHLKSSFRGFLPASISTSPEGITLALHRAIVEVLVMQQTARPLDEISQTFPIHSSIGDWTDEIQVIHSRSGTVLEMPEGRSLDHFFEAAHPARVVNQRQVATPEVSQNSVAPQISDTEATIHETRSSIEADEAIVEASPSEVLETGSGESQHDSVLARMQQKIIAGWNSSWLETSLENLEMRFAVLKRTAQLTGIPIPDHAAASFTTAKTVLNVLVTPARPRKLFDALEQRGDLLELENVAVYARRRSFFDKEADIGRLKILEEELEARGLEL